MGAISWWFVAVFAAGVGFGVGIALVLAYFIFSNFIGDRNWLWLLSCMNGCYRAGYRFGTPEYDACVQKCVDKRLQRES